MVKINVFEVFTTYVGLSLCAMMLLMYKMGVHSRLQFALPSFTIDQQKNLTDKELTTFRSSALKGSPSKVARSLSDMYNTTASHSDWNITHSASLRDDSHSEWAISLTDSKPKISPYPERTISITDSKPKISPYPKQTVSLTDSKPKTSPYLERTVSITDSKPTTSPMPELIPEEERPWKTVVSERFLARRTLLMERCSGYGQNLPQALTAELRDAIYYVKKYNFFACVSAKGGASTWKTHLLHMKGNKNFAGDPHRTSLNKKIRAEKLLRKKKKVKAKMSSANAIRVISVRHPLARLVSAYRDKFLDGQIVVPGGRYRFFEPVLRLSGLSPSRGKKLGVTFRQFLEYVVHEFKKGFYQMNRHWRPSSSACRPCSSSYDYIVKLETFDDDLRFLAERFGLKEIDVGVRKHYQKKKSNHDSYFQDLPRSLLQDVYKVYKEDFYLFDYEVPNYMKDFL